MSLPPTVMSDEVFKAIKVTPENLQRIIDWAHAEPYEYGVIVLGRKIEWGWVLIKRPITHRLYDTIPFYALPEWQFKKHFEES